MALAEKKIGEELERGRAEGRILKAHEQTRRMQERGTDTHHAFPATVAELGDAWEFLQPCTLTEGLGSAPLGPPSSRNPPCRTGMAEGCGTEFLDGFSGIGGRSTRPSRKDQFVDSRPRMPG
jgi:hypothetical protein